MKVVVLADSHGNYRNVSAALDANRDADYIIHAGDGEEDIENLQMYKPALMKKLIYVAGNCDIHSLADRTKVVDIGGVRIFIAHGDMHKIKTDKTVIARKAKEENCQVAIFGHSHIRFCETVEGVFLLNPGSCNRQGDETLPSYAVMTIKDGKISAAIIELA